MISFYRRILNAIIWIKVILRQVAWYYQAWQPLYPGLDLVGKTGLRWDPIWRMRAGAYIRTL